MENLSYEDKVNTNFQAKKIPKENASCKCLSLIMLNSVIRVSKKYNPQTLLEECKYDSDLSSSDNETDNESDNEAETDNEDNLLEFKTVF